MQFMVHLTTTLQQLVTHLIICLCRQKRETAISMWLCVSSVLLQRAVGILASLRIAETTREVTS
jgi:hypothetical protein